MFDDQRVDLAKITMENRQSMDFKKQIWGFNKKCGFIQENMAFESTQVRIKKGVIFLQDYSQIPPSLTHENGKSYQVL